MIRYGAVGGDLTAFPYSDAKIAKYIPGKKSAMGDRVRIIIRIALAAEGRTDSFALL